MGCGGCGGARRGDEGGRAAPTPRPNFGGAARPHTRAARLALRAAPPRNIHLPVLPPSAGVLPAPFPEDPPTTVRPVAARDRPRPRPGPRRGAGLGGRAPGGHWAGLILQAPVRRAARILGSGAEGGGQWRYFAPAVRGRGSRLVESAASGGCCSSRVDLEGRLVSWRELKMNKKKRWKRLSIPGIWKRHRRWTWAVRKSFDRLRFDGPGSLPLRQHLISKGLGLIACCSSPSNNPVPEKNSSLDWPNRILRNKPRIQGGRVPQAVCSGSRRRKTITVPATATMPAACACCFRCCCGACQMVRCSISF